MSDFAQLIATLQKEASSLLPVVDSVKERISSGASGAEETDENQGIPLLALKNDILLSYIHHLVILTAYRLRGGDLGSLPGARLTEQLIRLRLILEKARPLERKLRYQIDKAVQAAEGKDRQERGPSSSRNRTLKKKSGGAEDGSGSEAEEEEEDNDDDDDDDEDEVDTLAFRPNAAALMAASKSAASGFNSGAKASSANSRGAMVNFSRRGRDAEAPAQDDDDDDASDNNGVYRPPKLAPVPYDPDSASSSRASKEDRLAKTGGKRNAALLADLSLGLSSNPYELSSAGLGGAGRNSASSAQASARAKALRRMEEYEEENFTRLVMKKKDAKRRRMDEAAVALGGAGLDSSSARRGRLGAGLDEEFGDLLRGSGAGRKGKRKGGGGGNEDGYGALRSSSVKRAKVSDATLSGSSASSSTRDLFRHGGGRSKQSQFSKDVARSRRKS